MKMLRATTTLSLLTVLTLLPGVTAQIGTQVKTGDADHIPSISSAIPLSVNANDYASTPTFDDLCILLDTGSTATAGAQNSDLRLTKCFTKDWGTQIKDEDATEKAATYGQVAGESIKYGDVNSNGKYDFGDNVYLTTKAGTGLDDTSGAAAFTVRLTPAGSYKAGTLVFASDSDFASFGSVAASWASNGTAVVGRDDGAYYLVPRAPWTNLRVGTEVPANSVRLMAPTSTVSIAATKLTVTPTSPVAGEPYTVSIDVKNSGKLSGTAIIETKVNGVVADSRGTGIITQGATVTLVATLPSASAPGTIKVEVGTLSTNVTFTAPTTTTSGSSSTDAQVKDLASRVATLEANAKNAQVTGAAADTKAAPKGGSPGLDAVVVVLLLGLFVVRRRRDA